MDLIEIINNSLESQDRTCRFCAEQCDWAIRMMDEYGESDFFQEHLNRFASMLLQGIAYIEEQQEKLDAVELEYGYY